MPSFVNRSKKITLTTNYKVMYSMLKRQRQWKKSKKWVIKLLPYKSFGLVRNPYDRLVSFYFDKLNKSLNDGDYFSRSQRIFFPILDDISNASSLEKYQALKAITFNEFIQLLPEIYDKNRHLHPQYWVFKNLRVDTFLQIENPAAKQFMQENLGVDLKIKANVTQKKDLEWEPKSITIVNHIYQKDFEKYGYHKKNTSNHLGS